MQIITEFLPKFVYTVTYIITGAANIGTGVLHVCQLGNHLIWQGCYSPHPHPKYILYSIHFEILF